MGVEIDSELLREVVNPWLLGADPEFAIMEPPSKLIANSGEYAVEASLKEGGIGQDHQGRVWELRPKPSKSAYAVVTNMWKLLRAAQLDRVERFKWKSGALGAPKPGAPGSNVGVLQTQQLNGLPYQQVAVAAPAAS